MKIFLFLLLLLLPGTAFSQVTGIVFDNTTGKPVPFANIWIEDEDTGVTSNIDGCFLFKKDIHGKTLVLSSIGYETNKVRVDTSALKVFLKPVTYEIRGAVVRPEREMRLKIGQYGKFSIRKYYSAFSPQIFARFFPYAEEYKKTPFIRKIQVETLSERLATFRLRILSVTENGEPGIDLIDSNMVIKAKRGPRSAIVHFERNQVIFPDEGLFIGVETMILEENQLIGTMIQDSTEIRIRGPINYPFFGLLRTDTCTNSWHYAGGRWKLNLGRMYAEKVHPEINYLLAVEITLSNRSSLATTRRSRKLVGAFR